MPDDPFAIAANTSKEELNTLINTLIQENGTVENTEHIQFDFLIRNEYLQ